MKEEGLIHPSSFLDSPCTVGRGTRIWHFCHVMQGAVIGENCSLGQNVLVGPGVILGNRVRVQNNVSIYAGVRCEDDVFLGPSCVFTNVRNPRGFIDRRGEFLPTRIGKGATIGANATILCGNQIGAYAFVGAGAVVTHSVPDYGLVMGVPARLVGFVCRCGSRLNFEGEIAHCADCGASYLKRGTEVMELEGEKF